MLKAKKLSFGDTVAILSPSSGISSLFRHRVDNGINFLESVGFKVKEYSTTRQFQDGNAGTAEERANDLMQAFIDSEVKAIVCNIGGLSSNEILPLLQFDILKLHPKVFCGYSDISILHLALLSKVGLTTFYGPSLMTQFGEYPKPLDYTVNYFLKALTETSAIGEIKPSKKWTDEFLDWSQMKDLENPRELYTNVDGHKWLKGGRAKGKIIGGCLYSILQLKGTEYEPDYEGKILFIETPEGQQVSRGLPLPYVDSQIMDLRNAGIFDRIIGLVVGRGYGYSRTESKQFENILIKHTQKYEFPVLCNANIGHTDPIITFPLNVTVTLDSEEKVFSIDENGVVD
jgi:muramoyltetrapeptide carboxypeptidase